MAAARVLYIPNDEPIEERVSDLIKWINFNVDALKLEGVEVDDDSRVAALVCIQNIEGNFGTVRKALAIAAAALLTGSLERVVYDHEEIDDDDDNNDDDDVETIEDEYVDPLSF